HIRRVQSRAGKDQVRIGPDGGLVGPVPLGPGCCDIRRRGAFGQVGGRDVPEGVTGLHLIARRIGRGGGGVRGSCAGGGGSGLDWNARLGWCAGFGGLACLGWGSGLLLLVGPGVLRWFGPGAFLPLRAGGLLRRGGGGLVHWGRRVGGGVLVGAPAAVLGGRSIRSGWSGRRRGYEGGAGG